MRPLEELPLPRTELALDAMEYVRELTAPPIFNHTVRSYLYGRFLGEGQGLRPDHDYDDELLFLACVLHDLGLTAEGNGDQSFDLDGADLAARYLTGRGVAADRVEVVWDAVALHLTRAVALRKRPEIALVSAGAGYDIQPHGPALPDGYVERVHAAFPRLHSSAVLHDAIIGQALAKPHKAPLFSLPGELVRQQTGQRWPTWRQVTEAEPSWGDYEGYRPS